MPLSYKLHKELADEHDGAKRWGYRALNVGSLTAKGKSYGGDADSGSGKGEEWTKLPKIQGVKPGEAKKVGLPEDLDWFDQESVRGYVKMGDTSTTAQVHPFQFTTSLAELAVEAGAQVKLGLVTAIDYTGTHGVKAITYEDKETKHIHTLPATDVILAAGPWTSHVWPDAPIASLRAHSVVIEAEVSPYAIFSEIELPIDFKSTRHGTDVSPEIYPRPDGSVYACGKCPYSICREYHSNNRTGEPDDLIPLPKTADLVQVDESRCQDVIDYVGSISTPLRTGKVMAKQACYLPSVVGGHGPLIGQTGIRGLLMATGHTCWGIQNSCATGKLISEFVFEGEAKSARIDSLDPSAVL